jgi:hypothetical protein
MATMIYMPDGRTRVVHPANGKHWTLAELRSFVGGYTEKLRTVDGGVMVVNEAYKVVYTADDLNYQATRLWVKGRQDVILGPAVVVDSLAELEDDATS